MKTLFLTVALTASFSVSAMAQKGGTTDTENSTFEEGIAPFAHAISACYGMWQPDPDMGTGSVGFTVGWEGEISGTPQLIATGEADENAVHLAAINALEACAPYPTDYAGRVYGATFSGNALSNIVVAEHIEVPQVVWETATQESFNALGLTRADIAEIQARLSILGHDPNGIDGVYGNGCRTAVTAWQSAQSIPESGYLDAAQLEHLKDLSQAAFDTWVSDPSNQATLAAAAAPRPAAQGRNGWYRRNGNYCRLNRFGIEWCQRNRPSGY